MNFKHNKIKGFTLAEVLITLGIIGVVAAMTIPTLIAKYQANQYKIMARECFSKASQAVKQMRADDGDTLSNYVAVGQSFKPVFIKYFKVLKDYRWDDYKEITTSKCTYKTIAGGTPNCNAADDGQFMTNDGIFWGIDNFWGSIKITVDVNFDKPPNTYGIDTFMFEIVNDNLKPMGAPGTSWQTPSNCNRAITSYNTQGFGCMNYVMQNQDY